jgi:hypothetical protein
LRWAGLATPQRMAPYLNYWTHFDGAHFLPAWTLLTDDSVDSHGASAGMLAVVAYARNLPPPVAPGNDNDYYSLALRQLVALARRGTLEKLRTGPP